jgi:hypothetical protein
VGTVRGEKHAFAKNTEARVRELKLRALKGEPNRLLSAEFGISPASVSHIKTGRSWAHVVVEDIPCTRSVRRGSEHWMSKLEDEDIREIRRLRKQGRQVKEIAKQYGVSGPTISNILSGKVWKHVK